MPPGGQYAFAACLLPRGGNTAGLPRYAGSSARHTRGFLGCRIIAEAAAINDRGAAAIKSPQNRNLLDFLK